MNLLLANQTTSGNAAMYIFTDAGSKDCGRHANNIIRTFQFCKASAFFVLFDSCQKNIDKDYVKIAQGTGGFCLLVRDRAVYNITDTVNGAFESDALVCGEDIYKSGSKIGQGSGPYAISNRAKRNAENRPRQSQRKEIPIDDMIGHFKVTVNIEPPALVGDVRYEQYFYIGGTKLELRLIDHSQVEQALGWRSSPLFPRQSRILQVSR